MHTEWQRCSYCRASEEDVDLTRWEEADELLCDFCLSEQTAVCCECGERDWLDHGSKVKNGFYCDECQKKMGPDGVRIALFGDLSDDRDRAMDHKFENEAEEKKFIESERKHL